MSGLGSGQPAVVCPITKRDPASADTSHPSVATRTNPSVAAGASEQLQVTVPDLVLIRVESGALRVSTNTGLPPAATDGFYLIRRGRAGRAPGRVVETVLYSCR